MPATITRPRIANPAAGRPIARPFNIVICACCETERMTPPGELPKGWVTEEVDGQTYAFCAADAPDLPKGKRQ